MKLSLLRCSVILVVFLAGCPHDCYEVEVRPAGRTFHRKLTCWHASGQNDKDVQPLSAEQLAQIGRLYPKQAAPDDAKKQVFSGQFSDQTPADVGGAGYYTHFTSPLGSASCYVERFRGNDDLESQLSQHRQAADQLADLVVGWLTAEVGRDPNFPRLKKFLDEDLRRDLKNLGLYEFTGRATDRVPEGAQRRIPRPRRALPLRTRILLVERHSHAGPGGRGRRLRAPAAARAAAAGQKNGRCRRAAVARLAGISGRSRKTEGLVREVPPLHGPIPQAARKMEDNKQG